MMGPVCGCQCFPRTDDSGLSHLDQDSVCQGGTCKQPEQGRQVEKLADSSGTSISPQWDIAGFNVWAGQHAPFVTVGFLRRLKNGAAGPLSRSMVPAVELHFGLPPSCGTAGAQVFAVLNASLGIINPDPFGELRALVDTLDRTAKASDNDFVFWEVLCLQHDNKLALEGMFRMFALYKIQVIVGVYTTKGQLSVFQRLETMALLALSCFCQRVVNIDDPLVGSAIDLNTLQNLPSVLTSLHSEDQQVFERVAHMLDSVVHDLQPVHTDALGFQILCEESQLAWVRAPYLKALAERGGPCPRRQDIDKSGIIVGRPPKGRKFSISHPWDSLYHISPSGEKLRLIAMALEQFGATDEEDGVFLDYPGMPQEMPDKMPPSYFKSNGLFPPLSGKTLIEKRRFKYALWDMTRLYAYKDIQVIVLPQLPETSKFPDGPSAWGPVKDVCYARRGFCCSEFAISSFTGCLANSHDPDVKSVRQFHKWPTTVHEYSELLNSPAIVFGRDPAEREMLKGVLMFAFYKVCFGLHHTFAPEVLSATAGYELPSESALVVAEKLPVGCGVQSCEYYMYVSLQPPVSTTGRDVLKHEEHLRSLQLTLLANAEQRLARHQYPIGLGNAEATQTEQDLSAGRIHALVWGATGDGWEASCGDFTAMSLDQMCNAITKLPQKSRPKVIFVCMNFGASKAAARIFHAGAPVVIWIAESVQGEHCGRVIAGIVLPLLETLHHEHVFGLSSAQLLDRIILPASCRVFGASCRDVGCLVSTETTASSDLPLPKWIPSSAACLSDTWLHDVASFPPSVCQNESGETETLHEFIKVTATNTSGEQSDLTTCFDATVLQAWIGESLPGGGPELVTALYADVDEAGPCLQAGIHIRDVTFLHSLRNVALTGDYGTSLSNSPLLDAFLDTNDPGAGQGKNQYNRMRIAVDLSQFACVYEQSVLMLDKLTTHQEQKLADCRGHLRVHLHAPAGAGKTFVALKWLLERLQADGDARALFVARNASLCIFIVKWLHQRMRNPLHRVKLLRRLYLLFEPFEDGPREIVLEQDQIRMECAKLQMGFDLVIVDEAHHIWGGKKELQRAVEALLSFAEFQLLLSDVSQSLGLDIQYPSGLTPVFLTEVVRSSKRIVDGAAAFQLKIAGQVDATTSHHQGSQGPPLKSFVFPHIDRNNPSWMQEYVKNLMKAVNFVADTFPQLDLHDRVAIVTPPDASFVNNEPDSLRSIFQVELAAAFPDRDFQLVDARTASASVGIERGSKATEWLVFDHVGNFDGLERLIVIAVDLDAPIDVVGQSKPVELEVRSWLYRALTRAHILAIVVNTVVRNGWLEFLTRVRLDEAEPHEISDATKQVFEAAKVKLNGTAKTPNIQHVKAQSTIVEQLQLIPQDIWDTKENSAKARREVKPQFLPFVPTLNYQLYTAATDGDLAGVQRLLGARANVNTTILNTQQTYDPDRVKYTPLHTAACHGHIAVVKKLIEANAAVDLAEPHDKVTAMDWASWAGHLAAVESLLQARARHDLVDVLGNTAIDYAQGANRTDVIALLQQQ